MLERLKAFIAPIILRGASATLRAGWIGPNTKDKIWKFAQHYATYFDVRSSATIVNGMKMYVSSKPRVEQEITLFGIWEPLFTRYLQSLPTNEGIFLDIGANIGYFSLVASKIFSEVHAIEASPSTSKRLQDIITANSVHNINVHPVAVGAEEGHIDFYQHRSQSGGASTIKSEDSVFEARVPIARLEIILDGLDWSRVRFVKVDVEGLEAPVLDSLFRLYDALNPEIEIFVEFDPERPDTWSSIERFLNRGSKAFLMQGVYSRRDYVEATRCTRLEPLDGPPPMFCDLLLRRSTL